MPKKKTKKKTTKKTRTRSQPRKRIRLRGPGRRLTQVVRARSADVLQAAIDEAAEKATFGVSVDCVCQGVGAPWFILAWSERP